MKLPQRASQHITESVSYKLFASRLPEEWIVREVTERDYGVDCYIEICTDGFVTGKLLSVQLKGSTSVGLSADGSHVPFYSIDPSSFNYWSNLPVPVVFAYVDIVKEVVYLANVKSYLRANYKEFTSEKLTTLRIPTSSSSERTLCGDIISQIYELEVDQQNFEHLVTNFITFLGQRIELLTNHYSRDSFLPLDEDEDDEIGILTLYRDSLYLAKKLGIDWKIKSIRTMIQEGQRIYGDTYLLYEQQVAEFVKAIVPIVKEILARITERICFSESDYWFERDYMLWRYTNSRTFKSLVKELEEF